MAWIENIKRILGLPQERQNCSWEKLQPPAGGQKAFREWMEGKTFLRWCPAIFKSYHFQKCNISPSFRLQLLQGPNKKGVVLFYNPEIGRQNFWFLFAFLNEQSQRVGYQHHLSDRRVIAHERYTETIHKHYLKPPAVDLPESDLCNQLYGNLMIDLVSINGQPGYIRYYVNTYHDPFFSAPLPFDELMDRVFNVQP